MKLQLLTVCAAALALVGCKQSDRGGMGSDTSTPSTITNYDSGRSSSGSSSTLTNTNRIDQQQQQLPQGTAPQQGGTQQGAPKSQNPQQGTTSPQ